jgi:hypothetical protein
MTVSEVSQRTRIRETIIRDIERDDFASCGGDYYARGHIRAIARAIGTDAVPLIAEYDAARMPQPEPEPAGAGPGGGLQAAAPNDATTPVGGAAFEGQPIEGQPIEGQPNHGQTRVPEQRTHDFAASEASFIPGFDKPPGPQVIRTGGGSRPGGITAAEAFRPAMPLTIDGRAPRRVRWTGFLAVLLLAAVGVLIYALVSSSPAGSTAGSAASRHHTQHKGTPPRTSGPSTSPSGTPSASVVALTPASVAAFGPGGTAHGDNPSLAQLAIDGSTSTKWQSDWYGTASFAGLQSGTGLLLDMGKPVSVSSAQLLLGPQAGARVQLRVGNTPTLAGMPPVAAAASTGTSLALQPAQPAHGRYVLIWFTALPPDSAGTFQADLYNITVKGTA